LPPPSLLSTVKSNFMILLLDQSLDADGLHE